MNYQIPKLLITIVESLGLTNNNISSVYRWGIDMEKYLFDTRPVCSCKL